MVMKNGFLKWNSMEQKEFYKDLDVHSENNANTLFEYEVKDGQSDRSNVSSNGSKKTKYANQKSRQPQVCHICDRIFSNSSNLHMHLLIHKGEKRHKCPVCEQSFTQTSHLNRHQVIHTGQKDFECSICQRTFARSSNLKEHMITHGAEKNFSKIIEQRLYLAIRSFCLPKYKSDIRSRFQCQN